MIKIQLLFYILAFLGLAGCETYTPPVHTLHETVAPDVHAHLLTPDDKSVPRPGILLLPGASGIHDETLQTARQLTHHGYVVLVLDYYRGGQDLVDGNIINTPKHAREQWLTNISAAHAWLNTSPLVETDNISIVGFSRGAQYGMEYANRIGTIRSVTDYYGLLFAYDEDRYPTRKDVANLPPTLIIHGDADTIVDVKYAKEIQTLGILANKDITLQIIPDMPHAWWFTPPLTSEKIRAYETAFQHMIVFLNEHSAKPL